MNRRNGGGRCRNKRGVGKFGRGIYIGFRENSLLLLQAKLVFFFYKTRTAILNTTKYKEVTDFRNYPFFSLLVERCGKLSPGDF